MALIPSSVVSSLITDAIKLIQSIGTNKALAPERVDDLPPFKILHPARTVDKNNVEGWVQQTTTAAAGAVNWANSHGFVQMKMLEMQQKHGGKIDLATFEGQLKNHEAAGDFGEQRRREFWTTIGKNYQGVNLHDPMQPNTSAFIPTTVTPPKVETVTPVIPSPTTSSTPTTSVSITSGVTETKKSNNLLIVAGVAIVALLGYLIIKK